jgi:hypothetical protein
MKPIYYFAVLALIVLNACNERSEPYNTDVTTMIDLTDSLTVYPTAKDLLAPFSLNTNLWQSIRITVVAIADKDINKTEVVSLEPGDKLTGNKMLRRAKINRFISNLQTALQSFKVVHALPRSIIFRSIATQAIALHASASTHKVLLIFSDLLENSEVDFYDAQTRLALQTHPAVIEKQLSLNTSLSMLNGLSVWFLYVPANYHINSVYMPIARFYEHAYKAHHAEVHIAQQFIPQ